MTEVRSKRRFLPLIFPIKCLFKTLIEKENEIFCGIFYFSTRLFSALFVFLSRER